MAWRGGKAVARERVLPLRCAGASTQPTARSTMPSVVAAAAVVRVPSVLQPTAFITSAHATTKRNVTPRPHCPRVRCACCVCTTARLHAGKRSQRKHTHTHTSGARVWCTCTYFNEKLIADPRATIRMQSGGGAQGGQTGTVIPITDACVCVCSWHSFEYIMYRDTHAVGCVCNWKRTLSCPHR